MRRSARLAPGLAAVTMAILGIGITLQVLSGRTDAFLLAVTGCIAGAFSLVGAIVARRQPRNAIGWIFVGLGLAGVVPSVTRGYAERWLQGEGGSQGLAEVAAWYNSSSWILGVLPCMTFVLLLFPDGRLISRRWRPVAWCAGLGIILFFVGASLRPGPLEDFPSIDNPFGVSSGVVEPLEALAALTLLVGIVGSVLSLILRMRRATHEQRQQIKWLTWAGALAAVTLLVGIAGEDVWGGRIRDAVILLSVLLLPISAGIAILKYRLYDIDVVINRTLVYGALTASLAAAYLGSVLLLQLVLEPVTQDSALAVAGSTLAVAGLFRPARARIQQLVDRRFFRRRYDTARTLQSFSLRVRDEIDLDRIGAELQAVVRETMQPRHVSLWLRPAEDGS